MPDDLTQQPDDVVHAVTPRTPLHAGTVVYRVIEVDPPPDICGPHLWATDAVVVERASDKQIKLKRPFRGLARTVFEPTAFGRVFFETSQQAIQYFLTERRDELASLKRKREEVERALEWAEGQVPS